MKTESKSLQLRLNSLTNDQIKNYLLRNTRFDEKYIDSLTRNGLLQTVSQEAEKNKKLRLEISALKVTYKPSFFVLSFNSPAQAKDYKKDLIATLVKYLDRFNLDLNKQSGSPVYKNFEYMDSKIEDDILEFHLVWQKLHWYWSPQSFGLENLYELNYGLVMIDFKCQKAIISCHTEDERDYFIKIIKDLFDIKVNTLVLTKPLLEKIGSYDKVKRARYFLSKDSKKMPENITYADDKLSIKQPAIELESNPDSERKESFYRIPLGKIPEQGVGVTSDSGKLWISKNYPIDEVKEFALSLLAQISGTLDTLIKNGSIKTVFDTLAINNLPELKSLKSKNLRNEITKIIFEILIMILKDEKERPYTISEDLVNKYSIPLIFNFPRIDLFDPELNVNGYFVNDTDLSQLIKIDNQSNEIKISSYPSNEILNLDYLTHPISHNPIKVNNLYSYLELIPTPYLISIIDAAFQYLSNQFTELQTINDISFRFKSNKLMLISPIKSKRLIKNTEIFANEILQLKQVINKPIDPNKEDLYSKIVNALNEKCTHCSDSICLSCPTQKKYICLRSMVAMFLKHPYILSHKGIELSDIQGRFDYEDKEIIIYGFSKQVKAKTLTARNNQGAVLLAQIIGQVDKYDYDTVLIITPNTLSDDLYNRLRLICTVFQKRLLVLTHDLLKLILSEFEVRIGLENKNMTDIYRSSNKSLK